MPDYTVIIKTEYFEQAQSPKQAIRQVLDRSDRPDKMTIEAMTMPELIPAEPGTPEWLAARRQGVTATDAFVRELGRVTDLDGIPVTVGVDHDAVTISGCKLNFGAVEEFAGLVERAQQAAAANWEVMRNA